jgi:succinylglutamate desuccinylase
MLNIIHKLPENFIKISPKDLHKILPGPTLIHLSGKKRNPLFVCVLLHGNETTGFEAVQGLLKKYQNKKLPRALSIFVGNIVAARHAVRRLDDQPDYNRVWLPGALPEHAMMHEICETMKKKKVFASIDIHNNTGKNPYYACINRLEQHFFHLATLFHQTVVYFIKPEGVQSAAFAEICPAVTIECGQAGDARSRHEAQDFLEACLNLQKIPSDPIPKNDMHLFHTVAMIKVPGFLSVGFGDEKADIRFSSDLEKLNFKELAPGTVIGWADSKSGKRLLVADEKGNEAGNHYFEYTNDEIRVKVPLIPSMLTMDKNIIRQDCFGYIMEPLQRLE